MRVDEAPAPRCATSASASPNREPEPEAEEDRAAERRAAPDASARARAEPRQPAARRAQAAPRARARPTPRRAGARARAPARAGHPVPGARARRAQGAPRSRPAWPARAAGFIARLGEVFAGKKEIDPAVVDEIEKVLLTADIGVRTSQKLLEEIRSSLSRHELADPDAVWAFLRRRSDRDAVAAGAARSTSRRRSRSCC